ncbi:DMT family transporter [Allosphingosinicella vermicomposti]|uniref:DMT family transporter n=1 Tax=Allosphingosinicella vermicomposti TaxID=614671 RepID=UPI002477F64A|nr:DMT family transporter [Allosphingosinicella vermicomposti]
MQYSQDQPERPHQSQLLGIGLRIGAATSFAIMAATIKLGYEAGVSTPELIFYRFAFGLPPLLGWITLSGNYRAWRTERPKAHLTRMMIGLTSMVFAFSALDYLPLAEATVISFAAPLFSVILSVLILQEQVGRHRWTAVAIGFIGVVIVMRPGGADLPLIGLTIAVTAAFGVACVNITIRQIGRTESPQTTVLWFTLGSMLIVGLFFMPFHVQSHDAGTWAILIAVGLSGGAGQLFLTASLRHAPVPAIVPFDYTQLLWAVLLGWLFWDKRPSPTTWAGAAIIIASGLYTISREQKLRRAGRKAPATL